MSSLAVASFPASHPFSHATISDGSPSLHSRRSNAMLKLEHPSVDQNSRAICHDGNSKYPYSPILFRHLQSSQGSLHDIDDRNTAPSSPNYHPPDEPSVPRQTASIKNSIATLGLSLRSPSPKLDLLSVPTPFDHSRGFWDQHLPPRSSSLPTATPSNYLEMPRPHSSTPALGDDDQFGSTITFAAVDPDEPAYGSTSKSPLQRSSSMSSMPRSKRSTNQSLASTLRTSSPPKDRTARGYAAIYDMETVQSPQIGMMGVQSALMAPVLPAVPRTPKPKISVVTKSSSADGKSSLLSMKRMKGIGHRKSISSLNAPSPIDSRRSNGSASASTSSLHSTGTPELDAVYDPTEAIQNEETTEGTTMHVLVGDRWQRQDLHEVLPTLRSLRVSGKY